MSIILKYYITVYNKNCSISISISRCYLSISYQYRFQNKHCNLFNPINNLIHIPLIALNNLENLA